MFHCRFFFFSFWPPPPPPELKVYFNFFFSFSFLFFPYRATIWSVNARTIPSLGVPSLWADCRRERRPASPICSTGPASTSPSATVYPPGPLYCTRSASKNCTRKKFETVVIYVFLLRDYGDSSGSHRAPLLSHTATACFLFIIHAGFSFFSHSGGFFSFYLTFLFFFFSLYFVPFVSDNSGSDPVRIKSPPELADQTVEERLITFDWDKNFHTFQEATRRGAFRPLCWGKTQALIDVSLNRY